jgi:hypothetical protein
VANEEFDMNRNFFFHLFGLRWGFQYSPIVHKNDPYLTRWIMYLGWINLRLHKFYRGDLDRASHTHPWWFITFPFTDYKETLYHHGRPTESRVVERFKFHFRRADFEHKVNYPLKRRVSLNHFKVWRPSTEPFWTFVIAGALFHDWGFYTPDGKFIPWKSE